MVLEIHPVISLIVGIVALALTGFGLWYKIDRDTNNKIDAIRRESAEAIAANHKESLEQINALAKLFAENLAEAQHRGDEKRGRMYERLDSVKTAHRQEMDNLHKEVVDSFVSIKWCTLIHNNADRSFTEFKVTLDELKKEFKDSIAEVHKKIDMLIGRPNV